MFLSTSPYKMTPKRKTAFDPHPSPKFLMSSRGFSLPNKFEGPLALFDSHAVLKTNGGYQIGLRPLSSTCVHRLQLCTSVTLRWPGDSQRESGRFARIDSQRKPYFHNVRAIRANRLSPVIRKF